MKKISKFLSMMLSLILCFQLSTTCFASSNQDNSNSETKQIFNFNGHGQFTKTDSKTSTIVNDLTKIKKGDVIQAEATKDKEILHISNDKYLVQAYDNTYMMADKIDVNIENISASYSNLKKHQIPAETIENINAAITREKENGNKDFAISVFAPSIDEDSSTRATAKSNIDTEITRAAVTTLPPSYYTWNGNQMKDINIKYTNSSMGMEDLAETAKDTASALTNLFLSCVGVSSKTVSIFGIGLSALSVYQAAYGPVVYGQQGDQISVNVVYDKIEKSTYVNAGKWHLGCLSHKVWLTRSDTYQFYGYTGESDLQQKSLNVTYYSKNFINPAPIAVDYVSFDEVCVDSSIKLKIGSTTNIL